MLNGFNKIAPYYDRIAALVFGSSITKAQTCHLGEVEDGSKVLIIGGGTAAWLKDWLSEKPALQVDFVDASSEMIAIAKQKLGELANRVNFVHGTHEDLTNQYDTIVCPFIFDLFSAQELDAFVNKILKHLQTKGELILTDFRRNQTWWGDFLFILMLIFFKPWLRLNVSSLIDYHQLLQDKGMIAAERRFFYGKFIFSGRYTNSKRDSLVF